MLMDLLNAILCSASVCGAFVAGSFVHNGKWEGTESPGPGGFGPNLSFNCTECYPKALTPCAALIGFFVFSFGREFGAGPWSAEQSRRAAV